MYCNITKTVGKVINVKLSTKGQYAARAMLELALHYEKGPMLLRNIAKIHNISERYLERLMSALVSAGLVRSLRGQKGGFILARNPSEIRLDQVIEVVEGSISPVSCLDDKKFCKKINTCVTYDIWVKLKDAMVGVLKSISLEDMVNMHKEKIKSQDKMYYI